MSLIDNLKAAAGVGGAAAQIIISLERLDFCLGEKITGAVEVRGWHVEQHATGIRAFVQEAWEGAEVEGDQGNRAKRHEIQILAGSLVIPPDSTRTFALSLRAPYGSLGRSAWSVGVEMDVPHALHPNANIPIQLLPPAPLCGLIRALDEVAPFVPKKISNHENTARTQASFDFAPPAQLREQLNGVKISAEIRDTQVVGTLEIHPHENGVAGHLHSLTHSNWVSHSFVFEAAPLGRWREGNDHSIPIEVIAQFRSWLTPYLN